MAKEKTAAEKPEEVKEPKKAAPQVDKDAFIARKLKAINLMDNAFIAECQAERIMSRR